MVILGLRAADHDGLRALLVREWWSALCDWTHALAVVAISVTDLAYRGCRRTALTAVQVMHSLTVKEDAINTSDIGPALLELWAGLVQTPSLRKAMEAIDCLWIDQLKLEIASILTSIAKDTPEDFAEAEKADETGLSALIRERADFLLLTGVKHLFKDTPSLTGAPLNPLGDKKNAALVTLSTLWGLYSCVGFIDLRPYGKIVAVLIKALLYLTSYRYETSTASFVRVQWQLCLGFLQIILKTSEDHDWLVYALRHGLLGAMAAYHSWLTPSNGRRSQGKDGLKQVRLLIEDGVWPYLGHRSVVCAAAHMFHKNGNTPPFTHMRESLSTWKAFENTVLQYEPLTLLPDMRCSKTDVRPILTLKLRLR